MSQIMTVRGPVDSGELGFTRISEFVLPTLRRIRVPEDEIRLMMFGNPARILASPQMTDSPPSGAVQTRARLGRAS
jgi:predicted metal-dependent phosphotriesterase family hydrolase